MTDTGSPKTTARSRVKRRDHKSAVGLQPHKRTGVDIAIALITPLVGQEFLDKYQLRDPLNRALRYGTKTIFYGRHDFSAVQAGPESAHRADPAQVQRQGLFRPDARRRAEDDRRDPRRIRRRSAAPAAHDADEAATYPQDLIAKAAELGITAINIPEDFDGIAAHRSSVTNVLVAEALAYGDMGLALPLLAPGGVASALTHWGAPISRRPTYRNSPARTCRRPAWPSPSRNRSSTPPGSRRPRCAPRVATASTA